MYSDELKPRGPRFQTDPPDVEFTPVEPVRKPPEEPLHPSFAAAVLMAIWPFAQMVGGAKGILLMKLLRKFLRRKGVDV